ncbi:ketopantoate reductase family protein [Comamonas thiooxydans]|uniref:2-dehydropantoate 2-reductase n=1 Tax=Comamonas thiooxydans TaxID=363952 RepID=A0AA42TVQ2_9BURK|nr:ketopantoate reductase family protein [Comamonas thiooxydans]MDH1254189.1 ketopantoate reductase family protein [Comamonas thiooxydans]MDH1336360.1 ketopantoate reductase family protein [Comamonas thiooxydans]MDH1742320.1 ketopantoate reductase family protein [Comamonas thiooxydans]MDH1788891.1 ketopantoate reductase family protein [Comamonas thiooxydans]
MNMVNHTAASPRLSIAVMGAGSVGCYFGALLARAGHPVTLIGRTSHMQAISQHGLRLQTATEDLNIPITTSTEASAVAGADVVLFCVKSTDTEAAAAQIKPHLAAHTQVLSLQNGVDNDRRLRLVLGQQPVAAAVVYVATAMAGPGHVRHFGRGELLIAPCPQGDEIALQFSAANIPTQTSDGVLTALWQKLIINCVYNALSALTQQPYGWLIAQQGVPAVMQDIAAECKAVALADGVLLPASVDEAVAAIARTMPRQLSSTAQDLARGKTTEINHLNGYVVRRGQALGIATPINRLLQVLVQLKQMPAQKQEL